MLLLFQIDVDIHLKINILNDNVFPALRPLRAMSKMDPEVPHQNGGFGNIYVNVTVTESEPSPASAPTT
jgi:hypothetical protein